MTPTHTSHADAHEAGLADGCPRCAQLAEQPLKNADAQIVRDLVRRVIDTSISPRSEAEAIAVSNVRSTMEGAAAIAHAAPEQLGEYLLARRPSVKAQQDRLTVN